MLGGAISSAVNAVIDTTDFARTETFQSAGGSPTATRQFLVTTVTLIIILGALLFAGKFLWNNVLSVLVPAIKPAKSVWQILGLALLISLMHPGCSCTVY